MLAVVIGDAWGARTRALTPRAARESQAGEPALRAVNGASIIGTRSDASPMDDKVDIFFSTNPAAVIGRGYSPSQVGALGSPAIVPGASTFYWDGSGGVGDDGGTCRMEPGTPPTFG